MRNVETMPEPIRRAYEDYRNLSSKASKKEYEKVCKNLREAIQKYSK